MSSIEFPEKHDRQKYAPTSAGLSQSLKYGIKELCVDVARGQAGVKSLGSERLNQKFVAIDKKLISMILEEAEGHKVELEAEPLSEAVSLMEKFAR